MNELARTTIDKIRNKPWYSFSESVVIEICEAGIDGIEIGTVLSERGGQKLVREATEIVCYQDGEAVKRTPLSGNEDAIVGVWAERKSRIGHSMGRMG